MRHRLRATCVRFSAGDCRETAGKSHEDQVGGARRRVRGRRLLGRISRALNGDDGPMSDIDIPRPTQGDVIELILDDHRRFEDLLRECRRTDADRDGRTPGAGRGARRARGGRGGARLPRAAARPRDRRPRGGARRGGARREATRRCWRSWSSRAPTPRRSTTRSRSWRPPSTTTPARRRRASSTRRARTCRSTAARRSGWRGRPGATSCWRRAVGRPSRWRRCSTRPWPTACSPPRMPASRPTRWHGGAAKEEAKEVEEAAKK